MHVDGVAECDNRSFRASLPLVTTSSSLGLAVALASPASRAVARSGLKKALSASMLVQLRRNGPDDTCGKEVTTQEEQPRSLVLCQGSSRGNCWAGAGARDTAYGCHRRSTQKRGRGMTVFLFVTASVALLAGLVGLVAGHMPWTTGRKQDPRLSGMSR
jgi:hypothetical protein